MSSSHLPHFPTAFAAFATAAVEVLRGVVLHSTAAVEHQVTTNLPKSFVAHQKQQAGGAGKDEEELKVLTNVLAKLEGALGALPEPLTSAATAAVAAHAAGTGWGSMLSKQKNV